MLPTEIWVIIFRHLSHTERINHRLVCKDWDEIICSIELTKSELFGYNQTQQYALSQYTKDQKNYTNYRMDTIFSCRRRDIEIEDVLFHSTETLVSIL